MFEKEVSYLILTSLILKEEEMNKKYSRREFLKLAGVAAAGTALAACAPVATPTAAPATVAPATAAGATAAPLASSTFTAPAIGKTTVVNHWSWLSASDADVWTKMISAFNDANKSKGLQIEMTTISSDDYATKVLAASATGQAPDFGWNTGGQQVDWINKKVIVQLDDVAKSAGLDLTDFTDASIKFSRYPSHNNGLYLIPMDAMTLCMEINTDHAKAAGLDITKPPTTGADLLTWAEAMTQKSGGKVTRSGFLMTASQLQPTVVWGIVAAQMGFKRTSDDLKTSCINPDAGIAAMQWELDLFDKYMVSSKDVTDRYKAFGAGQGSMFWTGPWTVSGYIQSGLPFITVPVPTVGDHQDTYYELGGLEMYTQQDTGRYEATMEAVKWLSDNEFLWTTVGRGAACRKSILNRADYISSGPPQAVHKAFIDSLAFATQTAGVPVIETLELDIYNSGTFLSDQLAAVIAHKTDPKTAMAAIKTKWDAFLQEG